MFGTFRITTLSKGRFELHSIRATLLAESADKVRTMKQNVSLFPGTFVVGRIGCDDEKLLENALEFKGKVHRPGFDYIEKAYEGNGSEFIFSMKKECNSFGSREAGIGARTLIENLLNAEDDYSLLIDFADVTIVSSSFADEVFGRLFVMLGPVAFMSRISFRNVDSSVRAVIDRSISLRLSHVVS